MFRNEGMTIPEISLFNNWTHRSLCLEIAFPICMFPVAVSFLFVCSFPFLVFAVALVFLPCLWVPSVCVVGVGADFLKILFGPDWSSVSLGHKTP